MVLGLDRGGGAGARLGGEGGRDDRARAAARPGRHRRPDRARSASLSASTQLSDGIDFAVLAIGVFGVGEIIANLARGSESRALLTQTITRLMPTREEFRLAWPAALRGTGARLAARRAARRRRDAVAFAAYVLEKKVARDPSRFGRGAIEGVAGPEVRQQRRRADLVHPDADARHPRQCGDGADDRRA